MNYRNQLESNMEKILDKKNELLDKYFADKRIPTHRQIMTLKCLDKKYAECAKILIDFRNPGRSEEEHIEFDWEWKAQ